MIDPERMLRQPALQRPSAELDERIAALASHSRVTSGSTPQRRFSGAVILACSAIALCIGFLVGRTTATLVSDARPGPPTARLGAGYAAAEVGGAARAVEVRGAVPPHQLPAEPPRITFPEVRPLAAFSDTSTTSASAGPPPHFWVVPDSLPIDLATFEYH
jgi:hypothetical protein